MIRTKKCKIIYIYIQKICIIFDEIYTKKEIQILKGASEHICSKSKNGKLVAVENQYFFMQTKSGFPWYAKTGYSAL